MKVFFKIYGVELAFFAVSILSVAIAWVFLPETIPVQWKDGQVSSVGPKWILWLLALALLGASCVSHYALKRYFDKFPALAPTLSGMERLVPICISVVLLSCQACSMLAAWNVAVRTDVVLLVELLLVPIVFIALWQRGFWGISEDQVMGIPAKHFLLGGSKGPAAICSRPFFR